MRAFAVSLSAAYINDESKEVLDILYAVPSYSWNAETERFFDEVKVNTIALSGMKFFYLTRTLILSVSNKKPHSTKNSLTQNQTNNLLFIFDLREFVFQIN